MPVTYYRITFFDDEKKVFGVSDIVTSDEDSTNMTIFMKRMGIEVRISCTPPEKDISKVPSIEDIVKSYKGKYKYNPSLHW
jgi:hypothetical protein